MKNKGSGIRLAFIIIILLAIAFYGYTWLEKRQVPKLKKEIEKLENIKIAPYLKNPLRDDYENRFHIKFVKGEVTYSIFAAGEGEEVEVKGVTYQDEDRKVEVTESLTGWRKALKFKEMENGSVLILEKYKYGWAPQLSYAPEENIRPLSD